MTLTYREYWDEIRHLAELYTSEDKRAEHGYGAEVGAGDWLHETLDGHEFIIYTYKARCVLEHSENDDAMPEETGEKVDWHSPEPGAYYAMMADVYAQA